MRQTYDSNIPIISTRCWHLHQCIDFNIKSYVVKLPICLYSPSWVASSLIYGPKQVPRKKGVI